MPCDAHRWGATPSEEKRAYPCDAILRSGEELYRGVDVEAAASTVFRWLCQLRVAPYSYDWIDNRGRQSPPELTQGLERLEIGQTVMQIFRLVSFEPGRHLTLRIEQGGPAALFGDIAGTYLVEPRGEAASRLLVKLVVRHPRGIAGLLQRFLLPWGDLLMMRRQLLNLKALAEAQAAA